MNKFIWEAKSDGDYRYAEPIQKSQKLSQPNQETFFIKGKVRNLKIEAKRVTLWRTTSNYRSSVRFSKCPSFQKSILLRWWLRTLVCQGSGHAVWVRGHSFHIPTSVCIFSCPETIEGELGSFAPTLFNLIVKH